ncbi:MAG: DNA methyltransferase [Candidatus Korarchaeum sp.]|nr:DNA methyltransferase [Candidatus Korarchaeum sp.]MDW8034982.1 DNA methyltransferase [Candidatus Korarchaeum sp.]
MRGGDELREWFYDWKRKGSSWVPKVIIGDVRRIVPLLPDGFVDCIVTSPPYWMQRDYGHPLQIGREETPEDYVSEIANLFSLLYRKLKRTATVFLNIGYKYLEEELLLIPEMIALELSKRGYMLKNKLIWYKPNAMPTSARNRLNNTYEPVLIFVKRESKELYYFNVDEVSETSKTLECRLSKLEIEPEDYLGLRVVDSLRTRETKEGKVVGIRHDGRSVLEALVRWSNGEEEWLSLGDPLREYPERLAYACPRCNANLTEWDIVLSIANSRRIECPQCEKTLRGAFPEPLIKRSPSEPAELVEVVVKEVSEKKYLKNASTSSKYLSLEAVASASPAGRLTLIGEYLAVKRRWLVPQPLVAIYLRYWRERSGLTVREIDELLGYRDTASHWFRCDFGEWGKGGSLPRPSDWLKLKRILKFDSTYDCLTEVVLGLSTVRPHEAGRNPGDVWTIRLEPYPEVHFAVFPRELVGRAVKLGCPLGGIVLDPFAGSGTVGEVASKLGRKSLLVELREDYLELMRKRCDQLDTVILPS